MALKNNWTPKVNEIDDVDADDINSIADAVIANETDIEKLQRNSESVNKNIQSLTETVNTNADDIEDLKEAVEELQESGGGTGGGGGGEITQDVTSTILLAMYNEVGVRPSPENWFVFDENTGAISAFNPEKESDILSAEEVVFPWSINGIPVKIIGTGDSLGIGLSDVLSAKSIRFPNSIIEIGQYAFSMVMDIESINIPTSLIKLGDYAFQDCDRLHEIITPIKPNWEIEIGLGAFSNCALNNIDSIIDGIKEIPDLAFYLCQSLKSVTIPESVNTIGMSAFLSCSNLKIITVLNPNTVLTEGFCNNNVIIRGYKSSTAETYAINNGHEFIAIDEAVNPSDYYTKIEIDDLVGDIDSLLSEV
jgi:hypothetical protein